MRTLKITAVVLLTPIVLICLVGLFMPPHYETILPLILFGIPYYLLINNIRKTYTKNSLSSHHQDYNNEDPFQLPDKSLPNYDTLLKHYHDDMVQYVSNYINSYDNLINIDVFSAQRTLATFYQDRELYIRVMELPNYNTYLSLAKKQYNDFSETGLSLLHLQALESPKSIDVENTFNTGIEKFVLEYINFTLTQETRYKRPDLILKFHRDHIERLRNLKQTLSNLHINKYDDIIVSAVSKIKENISALKQETSITAPQDDE
ncbi:MAG: hypothetical protein PHD21_05835 [Flavobacteriales bacterium]|nr:hypothetical protein [Flavobacteriales bacterium]